MRTLRTLFVAFVLLISYGTNGQVAVNTDGTAADSKAMLDIKSTTMGMLIPRMTTTQREAISSSGTTPEGLMVYDETEHVFYYYETEWKKVGTGVSGWKLSTTGDTIWRIVGNDTLLTIEKTTPSLKIHGHISQTATGKSVFLGEGAGTNDDLTDNDNVFIGNDAGHKNTSGDNNTAVGMNAFSSNTEGSYNCAFGTDVLSGNTIGKGNTAMGYQALASSSEALNNTAIGNQALFKNTSGEKNTAWELKL